MQENTENILKEFENSKELFDGFCIKSKNLIIDLLKSENIKYHQITDRVKEKNKLQAKIVKKNHKYSSLAEITDLVGIRIITYFEDEVDKIANIIAKEFKIDNKNSIDKREIELDKFGYRSLHYVASLSDSRSKLTEYRQYSKLKFEVQIRTILQHSWAEIEHDIGYKGEVSIPQFAKRTFYRVAALLETADSEFVKLKNILGDYEKSISTQILEAPEKVTIDKASLASFIETSSTLKELDNMLAKYLGVPLHKTSEEIILDLLEKIDKSKISTIKQLEEYLEANKMIIYSTLKDEYPTKKHYVISLSEGISIYELLKHII